MAVPPSQVQHRLCSFSPSESVRILLLTSRGLDANTASSQSHCKACTTWYSWPWQHKTARTAGYFKCPKAFTLPATCSGNLPRFSWEVSQNPAIYIHFLSIARENPITQSVNTICYNGLRQFCAYMNSEREF